MISHRRQSLQDDRRRSTRRNGNFEGNGQLNGYEITNLLCRSHTSRERSRNGWSIRWTSRRERRRRNLERTRKFSEHFAFLSKSRLIRRFAFLDQTESVNQMAQNLTLQVREIASVTKAVANGDLTKTVDIGAQGEIRELKTTVNSMVSIDFISSS